MFFNILIVALGVIVLLLFAWIFKMFSGKLNFFATGLDSKFNLFEINMLWKLAKSTGLEEPLSLYVSDQALNRCVSKVVEDSKNKHTENDPKIQEFLAKLYKFRTKLALSADSKRGLSSSRALAVNQRLRIILKGSGIFASKIMNNASEIAISMPVQNGRIPIKPEGWLNKDVNVYLWRKGDAGYAFDTKVLRTGVFLGKPSLFLRQSEDLTRMQKRRSIRTECKINAQLYVIRENVTDFQKVETAPGYKCLIEDISSDGALVRIGGKGVANIQMKLQFPLEGTMILMYGTVRSVEFNVANNQSRLHLECTHIEPAMRNAILSFVYKVIPEEQKNAEIALTELQSESNENPLEDSTSSDEDDDYALNNKDELYKKKLEDMKKEYGPPSDSDEPPDSEL